MSEDTPVTYEPQSPVRDWMDPLDVRVGDSHGPCGENLEYDPEVQELEKAAAGKPGTQFSEPEPPNWPAVKEMAESLLQRTRDLRIAMHWCRASVNLQGFAAVPQALCLLQGMVDKLWDSLHPQPDPDDGDTFARVAVLDSLDKIEGFLGDVRQSLLVNDRRLGGLRVRTVEIALDKLAARADEGVMSQAQITTALEELPELAQPLRAQCAEAQHWLKRLISVMNDRFGVTEGVDVKALRGMLLAIDSVLPAVVEEQAEAEEGEVGSDGAAPAGGARRTGGGVHSVESRADAVRAIQLVCGYLDRSEPTNPAQLLLRRAARLIDMNFLQLVRDLAPEAVAEVARIMGVDPDNIDDSSG